MGIIVPVTHGFGRDHHFVIVLQAVNGGRTDTTTGGQTGDDKGIDLEFAAMDQILDTCIEVARRRET